jgi:hypothetical protein
MVKGVSFQRYYQLMGEDLLGAKLYQLNEALLRKDIRAMGYDPLAFPSLNPTMTTWKPQDVYVNILRSRKGGMPENVEAIPLSATP